ncbi:DUF3108 domain-containing protein [Schlegelella sp. S2-27]|uniref:DUF3108 domain-containing protein n=1 Tax=Caldimonas mangrovi TaxID=2944811 RepID=A0ABT0YQ14_9BURK|nr:DUF3108 domain-containing protein [Caldimonas mangrovi]MCM5680832.1 DUF3108 domain-containing protein [Caldimonas mangrovi]
MDRPALSALAPVPRRGRRGAAFVGLLLAVLAAHLWVSEEMATMLAEIDAAPMVERLEAVYARMLQPAAPPVVAPPAPAAAPRPQRRVAPPQAAASEPEAVVAEDAVAPEAGLAPPTDESAAEPLPQPEEPRLVDAPADAGPPAAQGMPFEWPPSTRMSYTLYGYYRGEVHGSAQVEWIRAGDRYQVHIDVLVGPGFAPLMARRMSSDGRITPHGLAPEVYEEETRVAFRTRRAAVRFGPEWITLNNGREVPAPLGVQDTASQFVQLTYRLMLQPELLTPGRAIEFPLALPRRQDRWYYDVVGADNLATPFGEVQAFHLRPRRETKRRDELMADVWFAPTLLYLPVRIVIRQDEQNYVDLTISKLPEVAAPAASGATPGTPP